MHDIYTKMLREHYSVFENQIDFFVIQQNTIQPTLMQHYQN